MSSAAKSLSVLFVRSVSAASSLSVVYLASKRLDVESFSVFVFVLAFVNFVSVVSRFGFDRLIVKYSAIYMMQYKQRVFSRFIILGGLLPIFSAPLFTLSAFYFFGNYSDELNYVYREYFFQVVLLTILHSLCFALSMFVQGQKRPSASILCQATIGNLVFSLLCIVGAFNSLEFALWAMVCSYLVCLLFCLITVLSNLGSIVVKDDVIGLLGRCPSLWIVALSGSFVAWGVQLISGGYLDSAQFAAVAVAQRVSLVLALFLSVINTIYSPVFAQQYSVGDFTALKKKYLECIIIGAVVSVPLVFILVLFSNIVMGFFGEEFAAFGWVLSILAFAQGVNLVTGPSGYLLSMVGKEALVARNSIFGAIATGAFCFLLIPDLGLLGAALTMLFGAMAVHLSNALSAYRFIKLKLL